MKRHWHTLADSTIKRIIRKKITWGEVMKRYAQPGWCGYPEALNGVLGCWLLTDAKIRHKISEDYCRNCDCYIKGENE